MTSRTLMARVSSVKKAVTPRRLAELSGRTQHSILHAIQRKTIKATAVGETIDVGTHKRPEGYRIPVTEVRKYLKKCAAKLARKEKS